MIYITKAVGFQQHTDCPFKQHLDREMRETLPLREMKKMKKNNVAGSVIFWYNGNISVTPTLWASIQSYL